MATNQVIFSLTMNSIMATQFAGFLNWLNSEHPSVNIDTVMKKFDKYFTEYMNAEANVEVNIENGKNEDEPTFDEDETIDETVLTTKIEGVMAVEVNAYIKDNKLKKTKINKKKLASLTTKCAKEMFDEYLEEQKDDLVAILEDTAQPDWFREYMSEIFEYLDTAN